MALVNAYLKVEDLKEAVGDTRSESPDAEYERTIDAASRWIDGHCRRFFWQAPIATPRLVRATSRMVLSPGDFFTLSGALVEVDPLGDGVFLPLDGGAWQPEPLAPLPGWPWERITPTGYLLGWPVDGLRARVRVTARWGWPSIPPQVKQACLILAVSYFNAKDITGTRTGFSPNDTEAGSPLEIVEHLLEDFAPTRERQEAR